MATTEIVGSMLPNNGSELTQSLESEHITHALWKQECETAMGAWKAAFEDIWPNLTVNFIPAENSDDGDELLNQIAPGDVYNLPHEKGLGDIRFAMHGPISALAHASFPTLPSRLGEVGTIGGDIHFDPTDSWRIDADTTEMAYSIRRVAAHEVGHSLGLAHYHGNWQPETDVNGNTVFNEWGAPVYIGQDYLMFPVSNASYNLGITIDQITKDALKALYTGSNARTHLDGWDKTWYRWEKIAEEIAKSNNENIVINITYSYMPEGIPILVDRNMIGTEGSLNDCCICCGTRQANMSTDVGEAPRLGRSFPYREGVGTSCYCGCCPCKPSNDLKFRLLKCERMHLREEAVEGGGLTWYRGECDATAEGSDGMEFALSSAGSSSGPESCRDTQEHLNSVWDWEAGVFSNSPARGCQGWWPDGRPGGPALNSGDLYLDVPTNTEYSEAWGFSGTVCGSNITVPDRPAYTFGETECLGMGILASLCCCRTGYNSDYLKDADLSGECPPAVKEPAEGYQFINACPMVEQLDGNRHVFQGEVDPNAVDYSQYEDCDWTHRQPYAHDAGGDIIFRELNWRDLIPTSPLECSMDCFSFNIRADETKYEYQFLEPVINPTGNCSGTAGDGWYADGVYSDQWMMSTGVTHSACSPCTYKQGICVGSPGPPGSMRALQFGPQRPLKGVVDPLDYYETFDADDNSKFPVNANTDMAGFHYIISGQCHNDKLEEPQDFKLLVAGAWKIHCDCQTGVINTGQFYNIHDLGVFSSCYETRPNWPPDHPNWKQMEYPYGTDYTVDCGTQAGCKCLGDPSVWWRNAYGGHPNPSYQMKRYLRLEHSTLPCLFFDGGVGVNQEPWAPTLEITTPDDIDHTWWKECQPFHPYPGDSVEIFSRGCLPKFPRNGWILTNYPLPEEAFDVDLYTPVGPPCDGVSWSTLDWQNGRIVSSEGIEGELPGDCAYSEGDKKCWFNPSACPYTLDVTIPPGHDEQRIWATSFGNGPECGSLVMSRNPMFNWTDYMGQHASLSCGCGPDGKCASFCEVAQPVYMFYTGIIEEQATPEQQPTHMCTYNILADSYAQAYTGNE